MQVDPMQHRGFLVVKRPAVAFAHWRRDLAVKKGVVPTASCRAALEAALGGRTAANYRGMQRQPIDRWFEGESATYPNQKARERIWELFGPDPSTFWTQPPWFDPDLLPSIAIAEEIRLLSDNPEEHEIIQVSRFDTSIGHATLGFDVGYWGSDHFSILADAMLMPRWHGCPTEQLDALSEWTGRLNESLLFSTYADAQAYREWYRRQRWAEEECGDDEFQIVRIDAMS